MYREFIQLLAALSFGGLLALPSAALAGAPAPPVRGQWVLPTGSTIAYTHFSANPATRPPVVYLHGGPGIPPRDSNIEFMGRFAALGHDVYVYDQAGTGASPHLADISDYSLARHLADLSAIRAQLRVETIVLVGVSWGAVLGSHYVATEPQHVAAAVFMSPGVLIDRDRVRYDYSRTASDEADDVILPPARMLLAGMLAKVSAGSALSVLSQEEAGKLLDEQIAAPAMERQGRCKGQPAPAKPQTRGTGSNYYGNAMVLKSLKQAKSPLEAISRSAVPLLILRGECDYIPAQALTAYTRAFRHSRVINLPGAGHALLSSDPDRAFELASEFLAATYPR